jgi:hypothetical protein
VEGGIQMQADKQIPLSEQAVEEPPWQDFPESTTGSGSQQKPSQTRDLAEGLRQAGTETARKAKEQGEAFLGQHKHTIAETMHHCGDALREAARQLRNKQDGNLASFADTVADRIERTSGYLESKQIRDIRDDVEQFARRQPAAFYGGMFAAGLALSRFFKASQAKAREEFEGGYSSEREQQREPNQDFATDPVNPI